MAILFLLFLCLLSSCHGDNPILSTEKIKKGPEMKPKRSNDNGYNCVDIHKQPAFDNPLLKNHKIQMKPSFNVDKKNGSLPPHIGRHSHLVLNKDGCPLGKVPIQRAWKDKSEQTQNISLPYIHPNDFPPRRPRHHFATIYALCPEGLHGAGALVSLWNPPVLENQFSMGQIWLQHLDNSGQLVDNIQAGWAAHRSLYGNFLTHLTVSWTSDGYQKTGCYNTMCPGFVQVDSYTHVGMPIRNVSQFDGSQCTANITILQDESTSNWWLIFDSVNVGYWPGELFNNLGKGANFLQFGGTAGANLAGVAPPMGSCHFPLPAFGEAASFAQIQYAKEYSNLIDVVSFDDKIKFITNSSCYDIRNWGYQGDFLRQYITFGGPGGSCGS